MVESQPVVLPNRPASVVGASDRRTRSRSGDPRKRDPRKATGSRKLYGNTVPRIFTKPLVRGKPGPCGCGCALSPATSLGFDCIEFAIESLGIELYPWQKWLLVHALELSPDGTLRFRRIVVLVARQNGKSTVSQVLALWSMFVRGARLVLGTAQDLDTAEEIWQGAVDLVMEVDEDTDEPVRPELYDMVDHVAQKNSSKALILTTKEKWKVKAANRRAARGLTGDLVMLDELREHQTWDAWGAITKTINARAEAQVWCFSNAGDITSVVLRYLRMKAHEQLGDPDGICAAAKALAPTIDLLAESTLEDLEDEPGEKLDDAQLQSVSGLFMAEWSMRPDRKIDDRDGWAEANPAMNYGGLTERTIAADCADDPEWIFRTEDLCQWPTTALNGPFKPGSWDASMNPLTDSPDGAVLAREHWITSAKVVACVAVAADRSRAHILICGSRDDGLPQVELHASRHGIDWVKAWLTERKDRIRAVTGQSLGEVSAGLMEELADDPTFPIPVVPWQGRDLTISHGQAYDKVRDRKVWHNLQPPLDLAAGTAVKKQLNGGWVLNLLASPGDAAPLQGFVGALWLWEKPIPEPLPPAKPIAVPNTSAESRAEAAAGAAIDTSQLARIQF